MTKQNPPINKDGIIPRDKVDWQKALSNVITDPTELFQILELDPSLLESAYQAAKLFPLRVPYGFVQRMQKRNPKDPLLLQALPLQAEFNFAEGYSIDPLREAQFNPVPGLLHKYPDRVLITLTGSCAIHCRYCFRRHFSYADNNPGQEGLLKIISYIEKQPGINEVILSGGDPLNTRDDFLERVIAQLSTITHVKRIRIHSRLPVVLPERITTDFIHLFSKTPLKPIMVIHCNHPNEIDNHVVEAVAKMRSGQITVLNQSVLLKGVNDNAEVLAQLSEKLFHMGVLPYYLHLLDKVQGAKHFQVSKSTAKRIHRDLLSKISGYLVPKLVTEIAYEKSKVLV